MAEKLNITDKAVSKWERGKSLPDSAIMLELCSVLKITVNDSLSGEVLTIKKLKKPKSQLRLQSTWNRQKNIYTNLQQEKEYTNGIIYP